MKKKGFLSGNLATKMESKNIFLFFSDVCLEFFLGVISLLNSKEGDDIISISDLSYDLVP